MSIFIDKLLLVTPNRVSSFCRP